MDELQLNLQEILDEKLEKIIPPNIKEGVTIFGVIGECLGTDTVLDVTDNSSISIEDTTLIIGGVE